MTKEEWSKAEEALKGIFSVVRLKIDGYDILLSLVRVSTYKNAIAIYIDGLFKGEWLAKDCEERRRFVCRKERSLMNAKEKRSFQKLSKKAQKELSEKYNNFKYEAYQSHWTSFSALKKHLVTNNQNIELIKID